MAKFVSIYADGDSGKVVTVTEDFAEGIGAKVLDVPALDSRGRPLPARELPDPSATTVKDILAEVGDDPAKARQYLDAENAQDKPRSTLVASLEAVIAGPTQSPSGDAGTN